MGAVSFTEKTRRLAAALRAFPSEMPLEWKTGYKAACRVVERVLDVRVLEG